MQIYRKSRVAKVYNPINYIYKNTFLYIYIYQKIQLFVLLQSLNNFSTFFVEMYYVQVISTLMLDRVSNKIKKY